MLKAALANRVRRNGLHHLRSSFGGALSCLGAAAGFWGFGALWLASFGALSLGELSLGELARAFGAALGLFSVRDSLDGRAFSAGDFSARELGVAVEGFAAWLSFVRAGAVRVLLSGRFALSGLLALSGRPAVLLLLGGVNGRLAAFAPLGAGRFSAGRFSAGRFPAGTDARASFGDIAGA